MGLTQGWTRCHALLGPQSPEETVAGCRDVAPQHQTDPWDGNEGDKDVHNWKIWWSRFSLIPHQFGKTFLVLPSGEETSVTFSRFLLKLVKLCFGGAGRPCWKRGHQNLSRSWGCPSARWWDWQQEVDEKAPFITRPLCLWLDLTWPPGLYLSHLIAALVLRLLDRVVFYMLCSRSSNR